MKTIPHMKWFSKGCLHWLLNGMEETDRWDRWSIINFNLFSLKNEYFVIFCWPVLPLMTLNLLDHLIYTWCGKGGNSVCPQNLARLAQPAYWVSENHSLRMKQVLLILHFTVYLSLLVLLICSPSSRHVPDKEFSQCHEFSFGNCWSYQPSTLQI